MQSPDRLWRVRSRGMTTEGGLNEGGGALGLDVDVDDE